jgi:hypothetical protein
MKKSSNETVTFTCACGCSRTKTLPYEQHKQRKRVNRNSKLYYSRRCYLKSKDRIALKKVVGRTIQAMTLQTAEDKVSYLGYNARITRDGGR